MTKGGPAYDSRGWWRKKARTLQHALDMVNQRVMELESDYDTVESELKAMLNTEPPSEANPMLLSLNHVDLALLADQWRIKYLQLHEAKDRT